MTRGERWGLHLATAGVALSGLAFGALKYFGEKAGEFGPEAHPWLPWAQHTHVLAGPMLVFAFGILFKAHVLPALRNRETRRISGLILLAAITLLILSGYLLQIQTHSTLRQALAWLHAPLGLLFLLAYSAHLLRPRPARQP